MQNTTAPREGLYDPFYEHDACGVGAVIDIEGRRSSAIVQQGRHVLLHLNHRGACGCEENTGDGAGMLIQVPHAFFAREAGRLKCELPALGAYGVGMLFLPKDKAQGATCRGIIEKVVKEEGQAVLGWREVP